MNDFLKEIVEHKKKVVESNREFFDRIAQRIGTTAFNRYSIFKERISVSGQMNLIAEIKKASPSQGIIREDFDVLRLAKFYREAQVSAISVLTEDKFFLGRPEYLKQVADNVDVPVLRKDFIIDQGQIYESHYLGASAVLLIVAILGDQKLQDFIKLAGRLDIDCLVEIHDEHELERALKSGAQIIGINNRNLRTLQVDLNVSERIIPRIPKGKIIVAESGIKTSDDVRRLRELGAHAVLIGETFMRGKDEDIKQTVKEIMGYE